MSFGKSDPPQPPNPVAVAGAQTSSNVSTAVANAYLNAPNQVTPTGSLTTKPTSSYQFTDPTTGQTYDIPNFTTTQTLSPTEQQILNLGETSKTNLAQTGADQSSRLNSLLSGNFDPTQTAPGAGQASWISSAYPAQTSLTSTLGPTYGYGGDPTGSDITRSYGPADNFSADRQRVEEALYGRLNPQLAIEKNQVAQSLADQGIRYGSDAYNAAMDNYNRQANDARLAVTQAGGAEQQRMTEEAKAQAEFQNQAQQQREQEQQARGQFFNQAAQQDFTKALTTGQFYNAGAAQELTRQQAAFNAQNAQRQQYLSEMYGQRSQPINEITALMSGSQVAQPSFVDTAKNQIPTTDVAGIINKNTDQQLAASAQQTAQQNAIIGGLFGFAGNAARGLATSDRRLKKNIHRVGTVFAATPHAVADVDADEPGRRLPKFDVDADESNSKELPIYSYTFKHDPMGRRHIGPMAQDVEKIDPSAVREIGGVKFIHKRRMMGAILRAA
jgi:hypothetical protein